MRSIRRTPALLGICLFAGLWVFVLAWSRPFVSGAAVSWANLNGALLAGTAAMAAVTWWLTIANLGAGRAAIFFALAFLLSWGAECAGVRWPFPFGSQYRYHDALWPVLPGRVPLFIPLAWWILAAASLVLLRDVSTQDSRGALHAGRVVLKASLGALLLVGCGLVLDPLGTTVHAWTWYRAGGFFGTPHANFAGWFLVGFAIYGCYFPVERVCETPRRLPSRLFDLVWTAANLVTLVLWGVASYGRLGSAVPTLLFLAVAGPFWVRWLTLLWRRETSLAVGATLAQTSTDAIS